MNRLSISELPCLILITCWTATVLGFETAQETAQETDVTSITSPFEQPSLIDVLQKEHSFFALKRVGKKIAAEYDDSRDEYQNLVSLLRSISGSAGSGSSSGPTGWELHFSGDKLLGKFGSGDLRFSSAAYGFANLPADGFAVQIMENQAPYSKINIRADRETDELEILYTRNSGEYIFRLQQSDEGQILVQIISQDEIFSEHESNFATLAEKHGEALNGPIAEILRYIGVSPPVGRFSPPVREQIINRLRPPDSSRQAEFDEIIRRIAAGKFSERESATQQLGNEYQSWHTHIHAAAIDENLSLEIRSRLRKIINTSASSDRQQEYELLQETDLENDPEYLVWILNDANQNPISDSDRRHVVQRLEKVTKQQIGDDLDGWKSWIESNRKPVPARDYSSFVSTIPVSVAGPLDHTRFAVADLVPLKLDEGRLKLNRDRWGEIYGGKQPQVLVADLEKQLEENRLPRSWIKVDEIYEIQSLGYPQILFENVKVAAQSLASENQEPPPASHLNPYLRIGSHSRNREFETENLLGNLMLHPDLPEQQRNLMIRNGQVMNRGLAGPNNQDRKPPDEEFFRLSLMEKSDSQRRLLVFENPDGDLSFRFEIGAANALISLTQRVLHDGSRECRITDVRGPDIFVAKAANFRQLAEDHKHYIESEFVPLLRGIGLGWDE